jgi:murein DD-endopeptidase MepM/ murein hydrolase activator NlpD
MIDGMNNIKQENFKSKGYSSKIRNKNFKPDSVSYNEMLKHSVNQIVRNHKDTLENNFGTRKAGFRLINSANDVIINSDNGKNDDKDDLGTQTVIKTKNALVKSSRTAKMSVKTGKTAINIAHKSANASKKAIQTTIKTIRTAKTMVKLLANPITLKIILIVAIVALVLIAAITAISSVTGIFSSLSFTGKTSDLNDTYIFITELDTNLQHEINNVESASKWSSIDNFHYYTDFGRLKSVNRTRISISTAATKLIAYLTSKYDDFSFKSVKEEIKTIHEQLYQISYIKWTETEEYYVTHTNVLTGVKTKVKKTQTIEHLDVELSGFLFEEWLDLYGNLDPSQKERYENILICGGAEMLKCYGSPFIDSDWRNHISSIFGYRIDPVNGKKAFHNGIDISMPRGTEITSVTEGIAKVGYNPGGYGKYVTITYALNEEIKISFLYAHCNTINVVDGQEVKRGDIIATVGSTGKSTGNHLHLTYMIDGAAYNPEFYLE